MRPIKGISSERIALKSHERNQQIKNKRAIAVNRNNDTYKNCELAKLRRLYYLLKKNYTIFKLTYHAPPLLLVGLES